MTSPLEHMKEAVSHLKEARKQSNLGTAMMIRPIESELEELVQRTNTINEGPTGEKDN